MNSLLVALPQSFNEHKALRKTMQKCYDEEVLETLDLFAYLTFQQICGQVTDTMMVTKTFDKEGRYAAMMFVGSLVCPLRVKVNLTRQVSVRTARKNASVVTKSLLKLLDRTIFSYIVTFEQP